MFDKSRGWDVVPFPHLYCFKKTTDEVGRPRFPIADEVSLYFKIMAQIDIFQDASDNVAFCIFLQIGPDSKDINK
ncbi:MAG: hypothetical protein PHX30_04610 [Candidatus Pacebacteria bacterium]|nr:hypothetical protein [Candidatus Paceibacterota bacterium]